MKKHQPSTKREFDGLLRWLDPDRERAGQRYEEIRCKIILMLARRGCWEAEELADETMNRVGDKVVTEIGESYVGEQLHYFRAVAHKVHQEWWKDLRNCDYVRPMPPPDPPEEKERSSRCLDGCMEHLSPDERELMIEYFRDDKRAKIDRRKKLAESRGVALNTLRMQVHRIKTALQRCVSNCLTQTAAA